ncbi:unnamed protein product [Haemonchus placei]|uniref:Uncharacterized protein n=1 Tax=Haemonchus placei TaxID=6290 RepID=A0A3P7TMZ3_HAEPC|nr:unnamed protein product [Haemonchus placei]
MFSTDKFLNTQNDRIIARSSAEASQHGGIAQRSGHLKSLTAITSDGKMSLIFLEKGVKKEISPGHNPISATGLGLINRTQLQHTGPRWYRTGGNALPRLHLSVLKRKTCSIQHRSLDALRATLVKALEDLDEGYLRAAVDAFPTRLSACIRAKVGYFKI